MSTKEYKNEKAAIRPLVKLVRLIAEDNNNQRRS